jgi:hypothetical protein
VGLPSTGTRILSYIAVLLCCDMQRQHEVWRSVASGR